MTVTYQSEALFPEDFIDVLRRSGLAGRRPVDDPERIRRMVEGADLTITARDGLKLVGVARSLTDFAWCCYLSDLAVDRAYQGRGIGRELIRRTREAAGGDTVSLILLAEPDAVGFGPKAGMAPIEGGFIIARADSPPR
jgi:ribosomal protein S18 acetylase RimI-like enzyme